MAQRLSQTLNLARTITAPIISPSSSAAKSSASTRNAICLLALRSESNQAEVCHVDLAETSSEAEAAVQKLEDAIHRIVVRKSAPDWLPFVPGASYWVPPRRRSYGIAQIVNKLVVNALTEEEVMSLTTSRGWPRSEFFIAGLDAASKDTSEFSDEEG